MEFSTLFQMVSPLGRSELCILMACRFHRQSACTTDSAGVRHPLFQSGKHPLSPVCTGGGSCGSAWSWLNPYSMEPPPYQPVHRARVGTAEIPGFSCGVKLLPYEQVGQGERGRLLLLAKLSRERESQQRGTGGHKPAPPSVGPLPQTGRGGKREPHLLGPICPEQKAQCSTFVVQSWGATGKESGCGSNAAASHHPY